MREVIVVVMFRINQHPVKSTSFRNCLASTSKQAEVSVDEVLVRLTGVGWIEKDEVRVRFLAAVVNKVLGDAGGEEVRSGAR